jgi:hypothetical protein
MTQRQGTFFGPGGIRLVLTVKDPATPAMVYLKRDSATYGCAFDTGEVDSERLTTAQHNWLAEFQTAVDDVTDRARQGLPEYGV